MSLHPASLTATFLMSDIEGSTRLWARHGDAMGAALEAHDALLRRAVVDAGGEVFKTTGDGMLAVFTRPAAAVEAALAGQRALIGHAWPETGPLRVRMAIHAGPVEARDGDYFGTTLNRIARVLALGHGGQVLVSSAANELVAEDLPEGVALVDRGEHRLRDIERPERVYQLLAPDLPDEPLPLRSTERPTNLPPELTSFVGRDRELRQVRGALERDRLVTLVGVGGTGKTRLMLHLAAGQVDGHVDGAWLVELAPMADPGLVVEAVARALGVPDAAGRPALEGVVDFLREKDLLLLLDNCEHVIDACARLVERLLRDCRSLRILATSREALGIDGEAAVPVPSLGLPPARDPGEPGTPDVADLEAIMASEAVRLFAERAAATSPGFVLDASTAVAVVAICRRLDGIPLAIELAAARVNVLSVAEIEQGLGDRFRLLTGGRRTAVPRQQTLQGLIDWSWDLLTDADQRLLRRLSVFAGGWTLDAACAVAAEAPAGPGSGGGVARLATLDGLGRLVARSLVVAEPAPVTRYRLLETIRQYAADRLVAAGEAPERRTRHLARFQQEALEAGPAVNGPDMAASMDRIDTELDNLRSALDWALETDIEAAVEITGALGSYWRFRSVGTEGLDRMERVIEAAGRLPEAAPDERAGRAICLARLFAAAALIGAPTNRRLDAARGWSAEAVAQARESGDRPTLATALGSRFLALTFGGVRDADDVLGVATELVDVAEDAGDWVSLAQAATSIALHLVRSDPAAAEAWCTRGTEAARRSGNPHAIGFAAYGRGYILGTNGRFDDARPFFLEAFARFGVAGDRRMQLVVRSDTAHALRHAGRLADAAAEYRQTILEWQRLGHRGAVANQLEAVAFVAREAGEPERAATLLGAADHLRELADAPMLAPERVEYEAELAALREALGRAAFERAFSEGRGLPVGGAVALALAGGATATVPGAPGV
jgi:predicted ATPase/class 3 adenylate cyclase